MKQPIIKFNCKFLLGGTVGMTIYPFIFIKHSKEDVGNVLTHEMIHWGQIQKDGVIKFYTKYLFDYVINIFKYKFNFDLAYRNIPYEKEAYEKEGKPHAPENPSNQRN